MLQTLNSPIRVAIERETSNPSHLAFRRSSQPLGRRDDVPEIDAGVLDLRIITQQAWDAIKAANMDQPFIFKHGGVPVWISRDDEGRATLGELTQTHIRHILARVAEFYVVKIKKVVQADGGELQTKVRYVVLPPNHVRADVLATPDPDLPVVSRLTESPVFAPDGTLQTTPGYHAASSTYLAIPPDPVIPPVKASPSAEEVYRARTLIEDDMLGDFPFGSPAEKANAIGLGFEQFVRAMIDGPLPLHSFEAPTPGSGKGLLADALLRPACGRTVGAISQAKDDDEWRKRITSSLVQGYPSIQIDNANKPIESGALSMALTIPIWTDRILGLTRMVSVPVRCSWVVTANNPTYSTEMARRTVRSRIDPKVDRPQDREGWRHPELLSWVDDNRGELIWAFCTLVRAWVAGGKPTFSGKALGSFERWSHVIGGILEHAGIPGFLANQSTFYDAVDAEAIVWRAFVGSWWDKFQDTEVGTADLFPLAVGTDELDLGNGQERSQKTRFGKLLGAQRDRVIGDYRVLAGRVSHKAQQWRLQPGDVDERFD
jgi:putative DNA primase/helicase